MTLVDGYVDFAACVSRNDQGTRALRWSGAPWSSAVPEWRASWRARRWSHIARSWMPAAEPSIDIAVDDRARTRVLLSIVVEAEAKEEGAQH